MSLLKKIHRRTIGKLLGYGKINYKGQGQINFIDVGSIGNLPSPWFENSKYIRNILKFEPQDAKSTSPNEIKVDVALWSENTKRPFYIYKGMNSHGASLFEQNFEFVEKNFDKLKTKGPAWLAKTWHERSSLIRTDSVNCKTLDSVLSELKLPYTFDFIKIDAQGAELEILRGAENFLRNECIALQLELFNMPLYKDIPLAEDVVKYLSGMGFKIYKQLPFHGSFNSQNDYVFIRSRIPAGKEYVKDLMDKVYAGQ